MKSSKPILLVEDDNVDAMTVRRALKDLNVPNGIIHQLDGEDALEYLKSSNNKRPCVILLDLNMPRMSGIDLLKIIKNDDELKQIPVIVITTSKDEHNKMESFEFSVAGYIIKSADYKKFVESLKILNLYWTLSESPYADV
ncbi:MAG: response regulator [Sedimentisphaerales bacterium]|jgi:CheY-like chemotaxis protein